MAVAYGCGMLVVKRLRLGVNQSLEDAAHVSSIYSVEDRPDRTRREIHFKVSYR